MVLRGAKFTNHITASPSSEVLQAITLSVIAEPAMTSIRSVKAF
jgi:hypothetical protein